MVRVFVCTSQINALYMILYARKTLKPGYQDVLILDAIPKRKALINVLINTKKVYDWSRIIDLSIPVEDEKEIAAGLGKRITRRVKTNPLVKPVYDILLKGHVKKKERAEENLLREKLRDLEEISEINMLTQTGINNALMKLYPKAQINYFEHGLGDYFFVQKIRSHAFNFYCVFANAFRKHLKENGADNSYVKDLLDEGSFPALAKEVLMADEEKEKIISSIDVPGKKVIILLDSMEIYQVPDAYWTDYLDLCISKIDNPKQYTYILKPHHTQTARSIQMSRDHMINHHQVKTVVIENSLPVNYGIEVLNTVWDQTTNYVFSTFSSGLYYMSKIYHNPGVKYYHAYRFFKKYTKNSPKQFVETYRGLGELMDVFSENAVDISPKQN